MFRVAWIGGRPAPIAGAKDLGIDIVLVHEEGLYEPSIAEHCERIVHAPITDGPAVLEVLRPLHEERPFDRVLTTSEPAGVACGHVVDALGLPGVGEQTQRSLKDKALTRELLAKHDLSPVRHQVVHSAEEAAEFAASVAGPIVLKPVDGAASRHINRVEGAEEAVRAWESMTAAGLTSALAEEFLSGPVVSVDGFSLGGRHLVIGYSDYRMNDRFVEWAVSTPSRVAVPYLDELRDMTARLLDAVGLTEGPSHSEYVLTPNGPRVLESHARLGGHAMQHLVNRAFGLDLARMMLTVPLGIDELPLTPPEPIGGAAIQFFVPEPGTVEAVEIDDDIDAVVRRVPPGELTDAYLPLLHEITPHDRGVVIARNPGDTIPPLRTVADCCAGFMLVTGDDGDDAVARCDVIARQVRFRTA
ncbi:ATP-grasp domain-containing protein [Streptomyces albireticuli]|uniref:Biotin carboxylase n=1 Tax=Streptomyces albireticuli TaxID=1940 RepID=A0A2A2D4K5_9ACTN|nr:ATP-grasp domain-containing protein [Streptomyces albireticuli]MCD9145106.1 ATP-grasp domain-containing protein [Streptomyces albireticuli]MCD9164719.1 ATP-grasp domain-containing protein [Streptomyces albireticuli]MCD9194984.1 ATP-grasp domain-containing protein [Streptomyces albireticuli]PAU47418.1 biotin carboxylase [Streptomyces albireticuli]